MPDQLLDISTRRKAVISQALQLMYRPQASASDIELVKDALIACRERINEEKQAMRCDDWWHGLDELDDDGNRRDDELWEAPVVDDELVEQSAADELWDGDDDWGYYDEVPR